ncbi:MAG: N-acetylmuramoyl-L-alanine amidase [Bacteroidales bacterium]|nr:N-acetylmuramoyl-L-alanine amidase [Bacteroidales bacterium]
MIEQSAWREGLPDPDYERIENTVHNIIIHHSAGSNLDTNYTGIVRNIYIYHTEIRGWSDIGYNYLVAADGTIFKGRDPGYLEQDNVLGAHFCGNNSGTMGICVMGTYTDVSPSAEALASLISLINWKAGKDSLDPAGTYPHILNASLPIIAGHRDGCSTICPGDSLYYLLDSIRYNVLHAFQACGFTAKQVQWDRERSGSLGLSVLHTANTVVIHLDEGQIRHFRLYNIMGKEIRLNEQHISPEEVIIHKDMLDPGIYLFKINCNSRVYVDKIICD